MKLKLSTVGLAIAAMTLGGVAVYVQLQGTPQEQEQAAQKLFPFEEQQVQAFTLKTQARSLSFQKDAQGIWQMTEPEQVPANDASVAYLLNLLGTGTSDRTLSVPATSQQDYGFQQPLATIDITLDNQQTHRLVLGGYNFNRTSLYVQTDPPATPGQNLSVRLVSPDFENASARPLEEWKQTATPTPSPAPTP